MNALDAFSEHAFTGLTAEQVKDKQRLEGPNALPDAKGGGWLSQLVGVFKEPMFLLLIACGSLYLVLGDLQEGLMLMGFVLLMIGIEWYQERKTGKALEALKDLSSPQALVIREGAMVKVPCKELGHRRFGGGLRRGQGACRWVGVARHQFTGRRILVDR